jgi:hypothetical protein
MYSNEGWPNCATMVMDDAGTTRTHFECYDFLSGSLSALAPSDVDTSASNSLGVTTITAPPPDVTDNQSTSGTSPPSTTPTDGNGGGGGGGDDDKGEAAPVGAIVGGVIGGVALLAAVGFGFWFMRRWKKNHGDAPAVTPATTQPTVYTGSPGTTAGGAYYAPVPQGYPPQGYPVQHYDPSKPYIPNEPVEAPSESAPRPPQNPPQELQ